MVDSKDKGARAETTVRDILRKYTKLQWERTPQSGALDAVHRLKGDLYIPGEKNKYTVEVKHYKDSVINHLLLTSNNHTLKVWWLQTCREAVENKNEPLLIFKHDRSKLYAAQYDFKIDLPTIAVNSNGLLLNIVLLEDWLYYKPEFIL